MKTLANEGSYLRLLIGAVAAILLGTAGIAAVMAWLPTPTDRAATGFVHDNLDARPGRLVDAQRQKPPLPAQGDTRTRVKCAECGVVESAREIGQLGEGTDPGAAGGPTRSGRNQTLGTSTKSYEVIVRLRDGSTRAFTAANSASWRAGERVMIIEGTRQPSD